MVKFDPKAIEKLKIQTKALSPVFNEANGAEYQADQACYLPIADRGRPLIGKVRDVQGVYIASG